MLEVKVDFIPYGNRKQKKRLYTMQIANIKMNEAKTIATYSIRVNKWCTFVLDLDRTKGAFCLLSQIFKSIWPEIKTYEEHDKLREFQEKLRGIKDKNK